MNKEARRFNAANESQVKDAQGKERRMRERELSDLREVLSTTQGRRFVWRVLGKCKVFETVWDPSGSRLAYNTGQQDVGHFVLSELLCAREDALLEMQLENRKELENV